MSRQAEIREQLIADGICSRENAPSRSSINQFVLFFDPKKPPYLMVESRKLQ